MDQHSIMIAVLCLYTAASGLYFFQVKIMGSVTMLLGIVIHVFGLISRGYIDGRWFFDLMADEILALPVFLALITFILFIKDKKNQVRVTVFPLVICSLFAFLPPEAKVMPALKTQIVVAPVFFLSESMSIAFFIAAGALALAALLFRQDTEKAFMTFIWWGFVIFTVCQILGAAWAFQGWTYPFAWNARHLASASAWCLYAALLHSGYTGIPTRTKAVCTVLGLVPLSFIVFYHDLLHLVLFLAGKSA